MAGSSPNHDITPPLTTPPSLPCPFIGSSLSHQAFTFWHSTGIWSVWQSFLRMQRAQREQAPPQIWSFSISLLSVLEFPLPYTAGR